MKGENVMKKFPKTLKTREDIYNCLDMVRAGELRAKDLINAIKKIKNQNYINAIIEEISSDRKTVTTHYLYEAELDARAKVGNVIVTIQSVEHIESEPNEQGQTSLTSTKMKVSRPVAAGSEIFGLEKNPPIFGTYGVTEEELDDILAELEG